MHAEFSSLSENPIIVSYEETFIENEKRAYKIDTSLYSVHIPLYICFESPSSKSIQQMKNQFSFLIKAEKEKEPTRWTSWISSG